jgi:hypothetical protein
MQGVLTQTMRFSVVIKAFLEAGDDKKGVPNHRKAPPQCTKYAYSSSGNDRTYG